GGGGGNFMVFSGYFFNKRFSLFSLCIDRESAQVGFMASPIMPIEPHKIKRAFQAIF
ncbi:hypothetical protein HMPREF1437_01657, partial [Helicobacter pylori HP116Bi]